MWINKTTNEIFTTHEEIRNSFQSVSLPEILTNEIIEHFNIYEVTIEPYTEEFNQITQRLELGEVDLETLTVKYIVVEKYANESEKEAAIIQYFVEETQNRLDLFAKKKGYDGILSACTYATSKIEKFQLEGQKCVDMRDNTWSALYSVLEDVKANRIPTPKKYDN